MEHIKETLFYDGSFNGFLTLLYEVQARNLVLKNIQKKQDQQEELFLDSQFIPAELKKARSVWNSLRKKNYSALKHLYFAFLSEEQHIEWRLFQFYRQVIGNDSLENKEVSKTNNLYIEQLANLVEKEKWAIERKLFIDHTGDSPSVKTIQPTYNVLPLISRFFRTRYKGQEWVIYDSKRSYGLHHRNGAMAFTSVSLDQLMPLFSENDHGASSHDQLINIESQEQHSRERSTQKSRHIQAVA
jgi:probable DNA metabolism protein